MAKEFYERLKKLNPPDRRAPVDGLTIKRIEVDRIAMSADSMAHAMEPILPSNTREMADLLYVFGKILDGEMQRYLNHLQRLCDDCDQTKIFAAQMRDSNAKL